MSELDDLVAACVASPDDDAPRLVWADAVGGERGELVVIQCRLERDDLPLREAIALRRRQRDLLARYGAAWSQLASFARRISFRRGFVDAAAMSARTFLAYEYDVRLAAPLLDSLELRITDNADVAAVVSRTRDLRGLGVLFDPDLVQLGSADFGHLRAVGVQLENERWPVDMPPVHGLDRLRIDVDAVEDVVAMLERCEALRALDVFVPEPGGLGRIAPRIPRTVTELRFGELRDGELAALAGAPVAKQLERLAIASGSVVHDLRLFDRFPELRALTFHSMVDFGAASIRPAAVRTLTSLRLPALRELAILAALDEQSTLRVAETFGPQLELLDLRNNHHAVRHVHELKLRVAGELLVEHPFRQAPERELLRVGPTRQMPWWDHLVLS